jgi:hypothetical protein
MTPPSTTMANCEEMADSNRFEPTAIDLPQDDYDLIASLPEALVQAQPLSCTAGDATLNGAQCDSSTFLYLDSSMMLQQEEETEARPSSPTTSAFVSPEQIDDVHQGTNHGMKVVQIKGKWGLITKTELYVVIGFILVVGIAAVVAVAVVVSNNNEDNKTVIITNSPSFSPPTGAPSPSPSDYSISQVLNSVLDEIEFSDVTNPLFDAMLQSVDEYETFYNFNEADLFSFGEPIPAAQNRAMAWLLLDDANTDLEFRDATVRFALASIYYQLSGTNWTNNDNWLSAEHHCEWYGIDCWGGAAGVALSEVDLSANNLVGTIPLEFSLLVETQTIWLSENHLSGPLDGLIFGSLPRLSILYLSNNQLTGPVDPALRKYQVLGKYSMTYCYSIPVHCCLLSATCMYPLTILFFILFSKTI